MGIVKCSCYFLTTFDDVTPSARNIIFIKEHNNIIFEKALWMTNSLWVIYKGIILPMCVYSLDQRPSASISRNLIPKV